MQEHALMLQGEREERRLKFRLKWLCDATFATNQLQMSGG
jgi:hypothetical protein